MSTARPARRVRATPATFTRRRRTGRTSRTATSRPAQVSRSWPAGSGAGDGAGVSASASSPAAPAAVAAGGLARLILEGRIKDGDHVRVTFDGNDFLFNGASDKKAA